jgi:hypothetical protein
MFIIAQIFGVIAVILGFLSYQMRTRRQILLALSATVIALTLHYLFLGAYTGMAMNAVSLIRNIAYDYRDRKEIKSPLIPIVFTAIQVVMGILTWQAWYSILVLVGIAINTYCVGLCNSQNLRKSILVTSPLVLIYNIFTMALSGIVFEVVGIVSAIIGIIRHRKKV